MYVIRTEGNTPYVHGSYGYVCTICILIRQVPHPSPKLGAKKSAETSRCQLFGRKLERPGYGILVDWETGKAKEELEIPATLKSKKTVDGRNDVSIDMENLMFFWGGS